MKKRLYKSRDNRILAGVMGGLGEYFDVDPTIFRLGFLLIVILSAVFPGLIVYLIAAIIVPDAPLITPSTTVRDDTREV